MDFQWMIIGEKMRKYGELQDRIEQIRSDNQDMPQEELEELIEKEQSQKFVFDDHYLSKMMIQESSIEFYLMDATQKIIDYQFETTFRFFKKLALLYIFGFLVPLLVIIFEKDA